MPDNNNSDGCTTSTPVVDEALLRHNLTVESWFSAFNGVFMGMIIFAAPIIVATCLDGGKWELTILACAFPCGAFLGPLWAFLGRRWGMQKLVTQMAIWANLPLLLTPWVSDGIVFTAIIALSQLLYSAMRMGQSSLYRSTYPRGMLGRVLGRLTSLNFLTMVPTVLIAGWCSDWNAASYRWLFPVAALFGLIGCRFYARLRPREVCDYNPGPRMSLRHSLGRVLATDPAFVIFQVAFFMSGAAFFMSNHITLLLTKERLGFDASELALALSVVPQLVLAASSPFWGMVMDRIGIVRMRQIISCVMTCYLASYFIGIWAGLPWLLYVGGVLRGISDGGGQVTWSLASVQFAPRSQDVPLYNGIHFVLNGIRGLGMPWFGSIIFLFAGEWTIFVAMLISALSIVIIHRAPQRSPKSVHLSMPVMRDPAEQVAEVA